MSKPHIVLLDAHCMNPGDLDWTPIDKISDCIYYPHTHPEDVVGRAQSCEILVVNKTVIDAETMSQLPWLKCICVTATGYNNIDIAAAKAKGITVSNVSGYSTPSVGQHVFALLLELTNNVGLHHHTVKQNQWSQNRDFCYWKKPVIELPGKTMGIYGMGKIGQEIAKIASAFDMNIIYNNRSVKPFPNMEQVDIDTLLEKSDVLCLAASLSQANFQIIDRFTLRQMKPTAFLINTSRGDLIDEADLVTALEHNQIAGAALDVLAQEPPRENHPLTQLSNCIVTPHIAWASGESRKRLLKETAENIKAFMRGMPINVVS